MRFFIIAGVFLVIFFLLNSNNQKQFNRAVCFEKQRMELKDFLIIITLKYQDSLNHNYNTIKYIGLNDKKESKMYIINESGGFYNSIQIGDTLLKEGGNLEVKCTNRDIIYSLTYNCIENYKKRK